MAITMALYFCTDSPTLQNITDLLASPVWGIMQSQTSAHCDGGCYQNSGPTQGSEAYPHSATEATA